MLVFELITPERVVFSEEIYEAILPTQNGQIAVLPNHLPIVTLLKAGVLSLRKTKETPDSQLEHVAISGGFVEVNAKKIRVLADTAERADEIDELRAQEAIKKAQALRDQAQDDVSLADVTAALERAITRIKVVGLKRRRHPAAT
jgi:F-type H+-transporting ATPase subunit epsilon